MTEFIAPIIEAIGKLNGFTQGVVAVGLIACLFTLVWFAVSNVSIMTVIRKSLRLHTESAHSRCPIVADVWLLETASAEKIRAEFVEMNIAMKNTLDTMESRMQLLISDLERRYESHLAKMGATEVEIIELMRTYGNVLSRLYEKMHRENKARIRLNGFCEMTTEDFERYLEERASVGLSQGADVFDIYYIGNKYCSRIDLRKMHVETAIDKTVKDMIKDVYRQARKNMIEAKRLIAMKAEAYEKTKRLFHRC
jgi:hypothetical protein